jgi:GNAT superfamily N-acetyltransferase
VLSEPALRPATNRDLQTLSRLLLELGYEIADVDLGRRIDMVLAHSDHLLRLAVDADGDILGAVHAALHFDLTNGAYVEIEVLVVAASTRRSGVGRVLVRGVELWAAERGCYRVLVRSQLHREGAFAFYRELGYVPVKQQNVLVREPRELRPSGPTTLTD